MAYKHDYDKILTRLTIILSRLNDGEALSVTELAKEFNVSERTIQSKTQKVEEVRNDGSMVVSVEITDDMEIIPFVKYWIPHIRVLEPQRIDTAIRNDIAVY